METSVEPDEPVAATSPAGLDSRRMFSATLVVMVLFLLSRLTGLAREVILSAQFGTSAEFDAYLAAFRTPDLLFNVIAGGALGSAFIPIFTTYWLSADKRPAWLLFSRMLNLITLILVVLAGLAAIFALPIVQYVLAPGFSAEQQELTAALMRGMLVGAVIFGASGLVMGALNATQHFIAPAAAPVVYNLSIILAAYWLAPTMGVYGLVVGIVVGSLAHLLIQLPVLVHKGARYVPSLTVHDPGVRAVVKLMGPRVLGLLFVQMHFVVNTILASTLAAGSLSALTYGFMLMLLPQGIFAQALATTSFPTFAAQFAAGQLDALRRTFAQTLRTVIFVIVPAAVALYVLRVPTIGALLEHGAFDARSTELVAFALQFYLIGLLAHSALEIIVRAFYAVQNTLTPVVVGIGAMLLNMGLSFVLVGQLSFGGLALANSLATSLEVLLLLWLLRRRLHGIDGWAILATLLRSGVAAAAMGAALWYWRQWTTTLTNTQLDLNLVATFGGIGLGILVYGGVAWLLRSEEIAILIGFIRRRGAR